MFPQRCGKWLSTCLTETTRQQRLGSNHRPSSQKSKALATRPLHLHKQTKKIPKEHDDRFEALQNITDGMST